MSYNIISTFFMLKKLYTQEEKTNNLEENSSVMQRRKNTALYVAPSLTSGTQTQNIVVLSKKKCVLVPAAIYIRPAGSGFLQWVSSGQ